MKYIMFEVNECPAPVLFPDHVPHKTVSISLSAMSGVHDRKLKSAGFVTIENGKVFTHGKSDTLHVDSDPEDAKVIASVLGLNPHRV